MNRSHPSLRRVPVLWLFLLSSCTTVDESRIREALTFYSSFDSTLEADFAGGGKTFATRYNHPTEKGQFIFESAVPGEVFRILPGAGINGGALAVSDVLERNGRIFYPAARNLPYAAGGWSGTASFWINNNPNTMLKTRFCDPLQITEKGATNGGLWVDFPDTTPRDLRLGAFSSEAEGRPLVSESDPEAPLIRVQDIGFEDGDWHHIVMTWANFDSGRSDGWAALYIDGRMAGNISSRTVSMDWNLEKTGIYVAVNYIGLLDELAIFSRPLTQQEIRRLQENPGLLSEGR